MATEKELAAALEAGLAGIAAVRWGWKALEGTEQPPSLPLVTLQRMSAAGAQYTDMCEDLQPLADTSIALHTWVSQYEDARELNATVRAIVLGAGGWVWQAESDEYEPSFRAWRISGEYLRIGEPVE